MSGEAALAPDEPAARRPKCSVTFAAGPVGDRPGRALIGRDAASPSPSPLGGRGHRSMSWFLAVRTAPRPSRAGGGVKVGGSSSRPPSSPRMNFWEPNDNSRYTRLLR